VTYSSLTPVPRRPSQQKREPWFALVTPAALIRLEADVLVVGGGLGTPSRDAAR
jgi:hypothetical protein